MTSPHICNLSAFNTEERGYYVSLTKQLRSAVVEERELDEGFAFRISVERLPPTRIAEWITLEQKCCPFFEFDLRFEAAGGPVWLQLTGGPGVKLSFATNSWEPFGRSGAIRSRHPPMEYIGRSGGTNR